MNMRHSIPLVALLLALPTLASAATFAEDKTLVLSTSPVDNAYLAGTSVTVSTPLPADLAAIGGTVTTYSPIAGDALIGAGTVDVEQEVKGDVRAAGGRVTIAGPVSGDVVAAGGRVNISGGARDMRVAGAYVNISGGARGPVVVYGADVTLSGEYDGDVEVIASDRFVIGEGTHIRGALKYNAPVQAEVPASAQIDGGTTYTGSYAYVPTNAEAQKFAIAGAGIFFMVRLLAMMITAGLIAGLFTRFTLALADRVYVRRPGRLALVALLGFGITIATPVLILLLLVSFVGVGLAFLLGAAYVLLLLLSYTYAGILAGGLVRRVGSRAPYPGISWKDALLGMFIFFVLGSIPYIGWAVTLVGMSFTLGAIVSGLYAFAFPKDTALWD